MQECDRNLPGEEVLAVRSDCLDNAASAPL